MEEEKQRLVHDLNERVKELTALHHTARLLQDDERTIPMLLQEIVRILPAAWEHPERASARIVFDEMEYKTPDFVSTPWTQHAEFSTAGGKHGVVEIAYLENKGNQSKAPFLAEEKSLLNSVAEMLQLYLERREAKERADQITKELFDRNKELLSLQQEMGRVEQLAALGWMTGAIAHELGTPLNSVLGYTQLLAKEELPEKARRHVKTIESQVQRMAGIVQYYLDRTHGSTSQRRPVNINELVKETLLLMKPVLVEKSVHLISKLAGSLPPVNAHAGSLQRVLINLLNNAVDALELEGRITVATRMADAPERQQPVILIEITDTGAGIPADLLPTVFDLFMTTKTHGRGTGLGLAVCQEIVKEHRGKIEIHSELKKGTSVKIFLPAGEAAGRSASNGMSS